MSATEAHNVPAIEPEGDWYGLYKGSTSRDDHLFTAASVRHPAKCSLALCNKILDTMQEWGWIETGSLVVDPFGGRGTTALCWISRHPANRALTVELEPHFVEMQNRNKEHAQRRLHRELAWVILQGDSRRFSEYYAEGKAASVLSAPYEDTGISNYQTGHPSGGGIGKNYREGKHPGVAKARGHVGYSADSAITSAPYADSINDSRDPDAKRARQAERIARGEFTPKRPDHFTSEKNQGAVAGWGGHSSDTPGQIGRLKDPPAAAITSAPYENQPPGIAPNTENKRGGLGQAFREGRITERNMHVGYTDPPAASVLSAPYAAAENRRAAGKVQEGEVSDAITRAYDATNHGQTAGNIANLPDACVTSAPWETSLNNRGGITGPHDTTGLMDAGYTDPAAAVTSAPFEDSLASDDPEKRGGFLKSDPKRRNDPGLTATYGDAAAVTSVATSDNNSGSEVDISYEQSKTTGRFGGPSSLFGWGEYEEHRAEIRSSPNDGETVAGPDEYSAAGREGAISLVGQEPVRKPPSENQSRLRGEKASELQARQTDAAVQDGDQEGNLRTLRGDGTPGDPSSGPGSVQRQPGQSRRAVQLLSSVGAQEGVLGGIPSGEGTAEGDRSCGVGTCSEKDGSTREDAAGEASAVLSPPYEDSINDGRDPDEKRARKAERIAAGEFTCQRPDVFTSEKNQGAIGAIGGHHSTEQGQIGVLQSETYAQACGLVYASLAKAGIRFVCSVTKDPVRKKKLTPLRLLTISLFEKAGYRLVAWRRAWLYHTQAELDAMAGQESLFGDEVEESKRLVGRLSFFRRLSLNRGGIASPFEDVLFFALRDEEQEASNRAVCEHGIPQGQYCAPCDDDYIARQEASPVGQPAQPPRWVQPGLF